MGYAVDQGYSANVKGFNKITYQCEVKCEFVRRLYDQSLLIPRISLSENSRLLAVGLFAGFLTMIRVTDEVLNFSTPPNTVEDESPSKTKKRRHLGANSSRRNHRINAKHQLKGRGVDRERRSSLSYVQYGDNVYVYVVGMTVGHEGFVFDIYSIQGGWHRNPPFTRVQPSQRSVVNSVSRRLPIRSSSSIANGGHENLPVPASSVRHIPHTLVVPGAPNSSKMVVNFVGAHQRITATAPASLKFPRFVFC